MNFNNFTIKSQEAVQQAQQIATNNGQQSIENGHLLKGILEVDENVTPFILKKLSKLYDCSFEELMLAAKYIDSAVMRVRCSHCGHWTEIKTSKGEP